MEDCKIDLAVVIVVVLVILAWFIGYIFLQKVEERKQKRKKNQVHRKGNRLQCHEKTIVIL